LPNGLAERASVPASPYYYGILRKSELAETVALPTDCELDLANMPMKLL
jgi:hypothetical protein